MTAHEVRPRVRLRQAGEFDPLRLLEGLPADRECFLLESGATGPAEVRRWSFLGSGPLGTLRALDGRVRLEGMGGDLVPGDPFTALDELLARWRAEPVRDLPPFWGGFVGFFAYDAGRWIEQLPATAARDQSVPDVHLGAYDAVLALDHARGEAWVVETPLPGCRDHAERAADLLVEVLSGGGARAAREGRTGPRDVEVRSNFDGPAYAAAVGRVRDYILAGDVFEVNLAQRFTAPLTCTPRELYGRLRAASPAPFSGMLDAGDLQVLSSSPERFLKVTPDGGRRLVETRPIKGTRPRGADPAQDRRMAEELLASAKDQAELAMIVDLSRNDLGRVCQIGTVRVRTPRALESYANVHQTVATVEGELLPDAGVGALLRATLPGGSITGAPKVRAMEIIEELEGVRRGAYCGALGYIGLDGALDLNILIRTMVCQAGVVTFGAGGAVVLDSDPGAEYQESLAKASAMLEAVGAVPPTPGDRHGSARGEVDAGASA